MNQLPPDSLTPSSPSGTPDPADSSSPAGSPESTTVSESSESSESRTESAQPDSQVIYIAAPKENERRRRHFEMWAALGLLILVMGGTWLQLSFYGIDSWLFIALFNMNSVLMLIILFLVVRNVVKLVVERRRNVFGARIRTRLVLVFVIVAVIPTLLMFLAANRVVGTSVDYWFTWQTETALQAAVEVGQSFHVVTAERLRSASQALQREMQERKLSVGAPEADALIQRKQEEHGLSVLGLARPDGTEQNWHAPPDFAPIWDETRRRIDWEHVAANAFGSLLWTGEQADYVIGILAVDAGRGGYVVGAERIGHGLMTKLERITRGFEEYAQLKQLKKPLKVSFQLILGVLGLITVFGSVWFAFRLSKEMTEPILALAKATDRVARGELDVRLDDKGEDELAQLVRSFNSMAADLGQSRQNLTQANALLALQNQTMSERRRYIETVLDNITTGVITLNAEGRVETVNKAACATFGMGVGLLEGRSPLAFLPPSSAPMFADMLETLRSSPERIWQREVDFAFSDRLWKLLIHAVAISADGTILAYVVVIDDITELEKMQRMAAWREVARRIAHEIKNPLTPIKLSAQRLHRKFSPLTNDPAFAQCTDLIVRQTERLQDMVQEFSAFAKLPEVQLQSGHIEPLIEELLALFRNSHPHIQWEMRLDPAHPALLMDAAALYRALLNVLGNAAEAIEAQTDTLADGSRPSPIVRVSTQYDAGRGQLRVLLADTGPGLSPEERSRLFEPYFSRKQGGTGLGLAIVKSIVADHRGSIRAVPAQGGGTVIIMELPVA